MTNSKKDLNAQNYRSRSQIKHEKVLLLGEFYKKFGREPKMIEEYNGIKIGEFLSRIRHKKTLITDEDRIYLENLNIRLIPIKREDIIHQKVLILAEFYKKFERYPMQEEEYKGVKLHKFFYAIRYFSINISDSDRAFLESLEKNLPTAKYYNSTHKKVLILGEFLQEFGRIPKGYEEYKNVKVGVLMTNIRHGSAKLSEKDRRYLESFNIELSAKKSKKLSMQKRVLALGEFYQKFGRSPKCKEEYNNIKIGSFLTSIKSGRIILKDKDRKYLENIGVKLEPQNPQELVREKILILGEFYQKFGKVPKLDEEYKNIKIGSFFYCIKKGITKICDEDRIYLKNLGIDCSTNITTS